MCYDSIQHNISIIILASGGKPHVICIATSTTGRTRGNYAPIRFISSECSIILWCCFAFMYALLSVILFPGLLYTYILYYFFHQQGKRTILQTANTESHHIRKDNSTHRGTRRQEKSEMSATYIS